MKKNKHTEKILKDRSSFYGCSAETFFKQGTTLRPVESLNGKTELYYTKLFNHSFISAGKELIFCLSDRSNGGERSILGEELTKLFSAVKIENSFPHFIYPGDRVPACRLSDGYDIRTADPSDYPPLQAFLDTCTEEDIEEALIDLEDPDKEVYLVYYNDKAVGYAGYRLLDSGLGDVGILVHPDHRRLGLGSAGVAAATKACLKNGDLPLYRTSRDNRGSAAIAVRLGYKLQWETLLYNCEI